MLVKNGVSIPDEIYTEPFHLQIAAKPSCELILAPFPFTLVHSSEVGGDNKLTLLPTHFPLFVLLVVTVAEAIDERRIGKQNMFLSEQHLKAPMLRMERVKCTFMQSNVLVTQVI